MDEKRVKRPTMTQVRELEQKIEVLESKNAALERSNRLMEGELALRQDKIELLDKMADHLSAEVARLKERNLWQRIFNR